MSRRQFLKQSSLFSLGILAYPMCGNALEFGNKKVRPYKIETLSHEFIKHG